MGLTWPYLIDSSAVGDIVPRRHVFSLSCPSFCTDSFWQPYFMYTVKWSVMQYVVIRPAVSIAGIICEAYGVLCESGGFGIDAIHFANIYLEAIDFVSITFVFNMSSKPYTCWQNFIMQIYSIALYGLLLFYGLVREELKGRRPLAKFMAIKMIVMFTFYQSFVVRLHFFYLCPRLRSVFTFLVQRTRGSSN